MQDGERQVAPKVEEIRRDHVARYEWASKRLTGKVVDVACGIGYGSKILAEAGLEVHGLDKDREALAYGRKHYAHPSVKLRRFDAARPKALGRFDAAVCFETVEHVRDPRPLLKALRARCNRLLVSVPNEDVFPWVPAYAHHYRHYTVVQLRLLLAETGWEIKEFWGQEGDESEVEKDCEGRTVIADCVPVKPPAPEVIIRPAPRPAVAPKHVAILALGPSVRYYLEHAKRSGGGHKLYDEVWTINALGDVFVADRIFHMDDIRIQEIRAKAKPEGNIASMVKWLKGHPGPIYTSRPHPDYPGMVAFPLADVITDTNFAYFNSTAAYAVAYAIWLGVEKLSLFGMDFTYEHSHHAEKGRACVEFWLGIAAARGIKLWMPRESSLMDACTSQTDRLYGYDTVVPGMIWTADPAARFGHRLTMKFTEREALPSATEIEKKYDHTRHVSPLLDR